MLKTIPADDEAHENHIAQVLSGRRQPGSGAINADGLKADVKTDIELIECKATNKRSFSITLIILEKIIRQAAAACRHWAVAVRIGRTDIVITSLKRHKELLDYERESRG